MDGSCSFVVSEWVAVICYLIHPIVANFAWFPAYAANLNRMTRFQVYMQYCKLHTFNLTVVTHPVVTAVTSAINTVTWYCTIEAAVTLWRAVLSIETFRTFIMTSSSSVARLTGTMSSYGVTFCDISAPTHTSTSITKRTSWTSWGSRTKQSYRQCHKQFIMYRAKVLTIFIAHMSINVFQLMCTCWFIIQVYTCK